MPSILTRFRGQNNLRPMFFIFKPIIHLFYKRIAHNPATRSIIRDYFKFLTAPKVTDGTEKHLTFFRIEDE